MGRPQRNDNTLDSIRNTRQLLLRRIHGLSQQLARIGAGDHRRRRLVLVDVFPGVKKRSTLATLRRIAASLNPSSTQMNKHTAELFSRLAILGFSVAESVTLRRCEMTLKRWAERECGDGSDWAIERAEPVDLQLINWPDINGPVWLVENRPGGIFPVRRFETTDLRDPKANRILARERRLNVAGKPFNVYHGQASRGVTPLPTVRPGPCAVPRLSLTRATPCWV